MLDTLQKMSGITHRSFTDSKTVTRDAEKILLQNEGKVSYTMNTKEVPVITYNDMAFISERNSIVFRAGDSPIWNRNETILPMSWRLFQNTITKPGKEFTLQTIPTLSSAVDFDVRKNQPDFGKMLDKRMNQAFESESCQDMYKAVYGYSDYDVEQLDPDNYADEIMDMINRSINKADIDDYMSDEEIAFNQALEDEESFYALAETNDEQLQANVEMQHEMEAKQRKLYAGGTISKDDLIGIGGINRQWDKDIIAAFLEVKGDMFQDKDYFITKNDGSLYGIDNMPYIVKQSQSADLDALNQAAKDKDSSVYSENDIKQEDVSSLGSYVVTDEFYHFLTSVDSWTFAKGRFDDMMRRRVNM